jgi:sulfoxide reductase heme-binding subunit YedZ
MSLKSLSATQIRWLKIGLFVLGLLPFVRLVVAVFVDQLGANPVEFITRNTGDWTLYLLCLTLAMTPLRKLTGWNWLIKLRRMAGLFAFFYITLHFITFLWFDHAFDVVAFILLIPLAVTSTNAMVKRLGGKRWQWLHRLIYVIVPLGVLHFWWMKAAKNNLFQPLLFAILVLMLLGMRIVWRRRTTT